jgi:hypothetical protein
MHDNYVDNAADLWLYDHRITQDNKLVDSHQIIVFRDEPLTHYVRLSGIYPDNYTKTSCIGPYAELSAAKVVVEMMLGMGVTGEQHGQR